jgi:methylated-DNA-[protein]-cysteine S-methyltransferase
MKTTFVKVLTPIGDMVCGVRDDGALAALEFADTFAGDVPAARAPDHPFAVRLARYFEGDLDALDAIATDPAGTPFQRRVWSELRALRPGETVSYAELARRVGSPRAVRAVGSANARNPVAIVVPCHRVVRSDGALGGYAGGVARKAWLLRHEGAGKAYFDTRSAPSTSPTFLPSYTTA